MSAVVFCDNPYKNDKLKSLWKDVPDISNIFSGLFQDAEIRTTRNPMLHATSVEKVFPRSPI